MAASGSTIRRTSSPSSRGNAVRASLDAVSRLRSTSSVAANWMSETLTRVSLPADPSGRCHHDPMSSRPEYDAIVLAGGGGRRLGGVDKATLEVGGRTLLDRVLA